MCTIIITFEVFITNLAFHFSPQIKFDLKRVLIFRLLSQEYEVMT